MFDGDRPHIHFAIPEILDEDIEAVTAVLRSGWLTTGAIAGELEAALAEYLDVSHALAVSSCTTALEAAVASLGLAPGTTVAVPAWTFVSTVTVLIRLGLRPVLTDVDPTTLNMSVESLERALDAGAQAVVPVLFGGVRLDPSIYKLAESASVPLIEDCAHALGASLPADRYALASCYSFYATKNLTSGEGGAVTTNDQSTADFVRSYRLHGMSHDAWRRYAPGGRPGYDIGLIGIKANMPDLLAALGASQLRRFPATQAKRRSLVNDYRRLLATVDGVDCVPLVADEGSADHLMVVTLPDGCDRDGVTKSLADQGVTTSVHFRPVHHFSALAGRFDQVDELATCERLCTRVLSLPLHPKLTTSEVEFVTERLAASL